MSTEEESCCASCAEGGVCEVKKSFKDKLPGGVADKKNPSDFDADLLADGVAHEMEHTKDQGIATEIAMDHLSEDLQYYVKLDKIEKAESINWIVRKNFKVVRKIDFQGLDISIENDKGGVRHWTDDATGEEGETKMHYPYGYICRTDGADGEQVDVYVGTNPEADKVFVVHQMKRPNYKRYDEDKVMVGFNSVREAKAAYLMHFDDPRFFGSMTVTDVSSFKRMFVKKSQSSHKYIKREGGPGSYQYTYPSDDKPASTGVGDIKATRSRIAAALKDIGLQLRQPDGEVDVFDSDTASIDVNLGSMNNDDGKMIIGSMTVENLSSFLSKFDSDQAGTTAKLNDIIDTYKRGDVPNDSQQLSELAAFRLFAHEMIHNAGPKRGAQDIRGKAIEEVATEIVARKFTKDVTNVEIPAYFESRGEVGFAAHGLTDYDYLVRPMLEAIVDIYDVSVDEAYDKLTEGSLRYKRWGGEVHTPEEARNVFASMVNGGDSEKSTQLAAQIAAVDWEDKWHGYDVNISPKLQDAMKSMRGTLNLNKDATPEALEQFKEEWGAIHKSLMFSGGDQDFEKGVLDRLKDIWSKVKAKFGTGKTKATKTWVRNTSQKCKTGVCIRLDGETIPIDDTFTAMRGMQVDGPPGHLNCKCTLEFNMGKSMGEEMQPPAPQAPPMMPPMGMGMGMPMMPPPNDVETYEGVAALLNRLGSVKDPELMEIASKIWGEGYNFEGQPPERARAEILGFLLDQRDLLGIEPEMSEMPNSDPSPSLPVTEPQGSSDYSGVSQTYASERNAPPPEASLQDEESQAQSSTEWFEPDSWSNNEKPQEPTN